MRYLLIIIILIAGTEFSIAQTTATTNSAGNRKTQAAKQATTRKQRGTGQYHGSRDTTPGSPMGTGGAGGGEMSGSPAASAIATDDQTSKAEGLQDTSNGTADTVSKKQTIKRTRNVRHTTRRNL